MIPGPTCAGLKGTQKTNSSFKCSVDWLDRILKFSNHNITSPRHVTASRGVNTADSREQPRGRTWHVMFQSMAAVNGQFSHLLLQLNQEPVCKEAEMKWKNCYFTIIGAQWTRLVDDTIIIIFIPENFRQSDLFSFNLSIKLWEPATVSRGGASDAPTNLYKVVL